MREGICFYEKPDLAIFQNIFVNTHPVCSRTAWISGPDDYKYESFYKCASEADKRLSRVDDMAEFYSCVERYIYKEIIRINFGNSISLKESKTYGIRNFIDDINFNCSKEFSYRDALIASNGMIEWIRGKSSNVKEVSIGINMFGCEIKIFDVLEIDEMTVMQSDCLSGVSAISIDSFYLKICYNGNNPICVTDDENKRESYSTKCNVISSSKSFATFFEFV